MHLLPTLCAISVVVATAKVQIFKQITTRKSNGSSRRRCCCYRKGTNFQANHNEFRSCAVCVLLLLLPQRYKFSSKSQPAPAGALLPVGCCCYRKGTNFQANHNITECGKHFPQLLLLPQRYKFSSKSQPSRTSAPKDLVVVATAKVQIFKQITTCNTIF